ncbi:MAG: hypothetical protein OXU20_29125 [Myxococcales bacterium]|nr:hypothetical protein [Myxococcales bacterium]
MITRGFNDSGRALFHGEKVFEASGQDLPSGSFVLLEEAAKASDGEVDVCDGGIYWKGASAAGCTAIET